MTSIEIEVERWLPDPGRMSAVRNVVLVAADDAVVTRKGRGGYGKLALPAPVNAHDHSHGLRALDFGWHDDALEPWLAGLRARPCTDVHLEALVAFGRLAQAGCGATVHCHSSLHHDRIVDDAGEVARAARECGIRVAISCPLQDTSAWVYGGPSELRSVLDQSDWDRLSPLVPQFPSFRQQIAAVEEIARLYSGEGVDVQFGPVGPQWASNEMLEAIAEASARSGLRIHTHLLGTSRQRDWLDRRFPGGVIAYLDSIGFLSPRLSVVDGNHLQPDECDLLAERGVTVVTNSSANLRRRFGPAPLSKLRRSGLPFAIGLDGSGLDDDQDIWREMRLTWLVNSGSDLDHPIAPADIFSAAISNGAVVVNQPSGRDIVVVDYAGLTEDSLFDDLDESVLLLNRMCAKHVTDLVVGGRHVVRDRHLATFDFDAAREELREQARAVLPELRRKRDDARLLSEAIRRYYQRFYVAAE